MKDLSDVLGWFRQMAPWETAPIQILSSSLRSIQGMKKEIERIKRFQTILVNHVLVKDEALRAAAAQFQTYALAHEERQNVEKAKVNRTFASHCAGAAALKLPYYINPPTEKETPK